MTTNQQKTLPNLPPSVASTAAWIYPATFYHPQNTPRIHYYSHQNPWGTGDPHSSYYSDFFEYPVTSPPATRNTAYCACYDHLHGTVRRRLPKCKQCSKSNQPSTRRPQVQTPSSESTLKKLTNAGSNPEKRESSPAVKKSAANLDFNVTNRLNKKTFGVQIEDEWQSYWDQDEIISTDQDQQDFFTQHLKSDKILPKSEITSPVKEIVPTVELTTFAALKKDSVKTEPLQEVTDPVVPESETEPLNIEIPTENHEVKQHEVINNELKEFVKQRYAKRYRSKFHKRKTTSTIIDEVIIEENEEDIERAESEEYTDLKPILKRNSLCTDSDESSKDSDYSILQHLDETPQNPINMNMMLKLKRKKGVTFCPETSTPSRRVVDHPKIDHSKIGHPKLELKRGTEGSSSEDEFTGYCKVVVSQNLADEILDEIYGKIDNKYENSAVSGSGAIEAPLNDQQPKSLADEILDELYGTTKPKVEENNYEEIVRKPEGPPSPIINGKIILKFCYY